MKTEYVYIRIIASLLMLAFCWGYAGPVLISSPTDIGLYGGIALVLLAPIGAYWLLKPLWKNETDTSTNQTTKTN